MELELQQAQLAGYHSCLDTTVSHEETTEMIVPDACPDILRIIDTEGMVYLTGKEVLEGRVELTGTAKAAVLYQPDGCEGLRRLEVSLPFHCNVEGTGVKVGYPVVACARVRTADTRVLNPRKVLARVDLLISLSVWSPIRETVCVGMTAEDALGLEQRQETHNTYLVTSVQEKSFTFSDDLSFSASRPAAEELLRHRVNLQCVESKVIGNKLIFKGEAVLHILYRTAEGTLCSHRWELPFSQIMEVTGVQEEADCDLQVTLSGCELTLGIDSSGDRRSVSVSLTILAQAILWEERRVTLVTDAYSTLRPLALEFFPYRFAQRLDETVQPQQVRGVLELGEAAKAVEDVFVELGQTAVARDGEYVVYTADTFVTVLYRGEDDGFYAASRQLPVSCRVKSPEGSDCTYRCGAPTELQATTTGAGIEVRYSVSFRVLTLTERGVTAVSSGTVEEAQKRSAEEEPSIILRVMGRERLWDVAKSYHTTMAEIIAANELSGEDVKSGTLLLIPQKR